MNKNSPQAAARCRYPIQTGAILALFGSLTFSLKPILIKLIYVYQVSPEVLMTLRMLCALPIFLAIGLFSVRQNRQRPPMTLRNIAQAGAVGLLGYYAASYLDLAGLKYISAQFERMILFTYPTFVVIFAWLLFSKPITRRMLIALPLSYAGVVLIFFHDVQSMGADVVHGGLLVFASALCFAAYILFSKPCIDRLGSTLFTCWAMASASVMICLHFLWTHPLSSLIVPIPALLLCLLLAVAVTALPSFLMSAAIARIGASRSSVIGTMGPVSTTLLAVLLLGETFSIYHAVGMLMTIVGVVYLSLQKG